jgi:chemotaxis protein CheD
MEKKLFVPMGRCMLGENQCRLYCMGLGSCVAVCVYEGKKKTGGLAHVLLPYGEDANRPYYFANLAVKFMIDDLKKIGIIRERIWAKIAGGANIFSGVSGDNAIGSKNVEAVKYWLNHFKIPVVGEDVGGIEGRNVTFDLENGKIEIFTLKKGYRCI